MLPAYRIQSRGDRCTRLTAYSEAVHVDNLSPSLWGGFILVRGYDPIDVVPIHVPENLWCTVISPHKEIQTKESRRILPKHIPLLDVIRQTGNAAGLIAGLLRDDYELIGRSLQDVIAEPVRKSMIPGFDAMKAAALNAGALGCSISGSGPSLFALAKSEETARKVGYEMGSILNSVGCEYSLFVSRISQQGARTIP